MAVVHMVQAAIHQPIDMIAMRHRFVPATRAVHVRAGHRCRAAIGIGNADRDHMFIDMIAMRVMQMAIVQIIDMAIMAHGGVAAARPVRVVMFGVGDARHGRQPFIRQGLPLHGASVAT
jgi:hypothetical protein